MNKLLLSSVIAFTMAASAVAADQTWNGKISDSMCGAAHKTEAEPKIEMEKGNKTSSE